MGTVAPVFTLKDTADKPVDFFSFRGSYVLLDFWASWCGPCRRENPNLVNLYKNYKQKNFTIVSVAINDDRQRWLKAIKKDGLLWTQLSDVEGRHNSAKEMYGVLGIPLSLALVVDQRFLFCYISLGRSVSGHCNLPLETNI